MSLLLIVLIPFFGAALLAWDNRQCRMRAAWIAGSVTLSALLLALPLLHAPFAGKTIVQRFTWIEAAGLNLAFRFDGLGMLFTLMILIIGLLIIMYARYYLAPEENCGRFYSYLMLFMGAMLGVALSENIIQLLMFWELTSLSSFLLISFWYQDSAARNGARMALTVTGAGGLALFGGFLLLGKIVGSYDLSVILASGNTIRSHQLYLPTLILILLGAFTKSAQFPFHFWLPNAMAAPTPVSAYLHSATMVKAGVFLLARLFPALSGTKEWAMIVGVVGLITLLMGAVIALFQHDLKGLLAYSTISHLGLITMLFGIGTPLAAVAGVFHIINHATFKASLFMAAGIIDHEAGTRDLRRLNGLWKFMPHTAILAIVASAAMAGVPLLNGFLSKEMFFAEAVGLTTKMRFGWLTPIAVTIAGIFAVAYSLRFIRNVFFNGSGSGLPKTPHEPPRWMKVPVEILVALCVLVGMFPVLTVEPLLAVAAIGVLQGPLPQHDLAIWHGINPALWMSVIALIGGCLLYVWRRPLFTLYERHEHKLQAAAIYEFLLRRLSILAQRITQHLDTGSLQRMLFIFVLVAIILGSFGYISAPMQLTGSAAHTPLDAVSLLIGVIMMVAGISTIFYRQQRLIALLISGVIGIGVVLIFVRFSAPDLALTQLSVEVVTIILWLLGLYFLPQYAPREMNHRRQGWHMLLAISSGIGVAALAWAVMTRPHLSIADYFIDNSLAGGGGTNIVNVILVDFRGYDTFNEIGVLTLAALGVCALLQSLRLPGMAYDAQGRPWSADIYPMILASLTRLLLPLVILVSAFIFLRGHNLPGGGFVAGLVSAVALIMLYMSHGTAWMNARLTWNFHFMLGLGLLIATLTGLASWIFSKPFLSSAFSFLHLPLLGELELASAIAFDAGVYLVVFAATLLILAYLGAMHQTPAHSTEEQR